MSASTPSTRHANRIHTHCHDECLEYVMNISVFDVRGSAHHSTIHKEKSNKMQQCIKISLFHIYMKLNMFRGETPPIIRSLKLHWQPLVFHMWKVVGRVVGECCQARYVQPTTALAASGFS